LILRKEFDTLVEVCKASPLFQAKLAELKLPEGFEAIIEPWPYGAPELDEKSLRFFQALIFAHDKRSGNPDANFYAYPLPLIPIMDAHKKELIRIDELATGGVSDGLRDKTHLATIIDHCKSSEYVPELLPTGVRSDLKQLGVVQPDGPSFRVTDGNLIKWQKWQMRVTFNPREGAVVHDIRYDGRSVLYRLSMSEMVNATFLLPQWSR
jgi:primary-amine oxidase